MNKQTYGYDTNNYEVTVGNIKDEGIKLEVKQPMFEDGELKRFDNYIHDIVKEYSKLMFKEKDKILTQRIIMKQEQEIERLNNIIKEVREYIDTLEKQHAYKFVEVDNHTEMRIDENEYLVWCKYNKLLKILDKGSDKE